MALPATDLAADQPRPSATADTVGVVFVTLNARRHLSLCLPPVLASPLRPRVLVVDSSSDDGTAQEARRLGAETLVIPQAQFDHGLTRELARRHLATDIVVMMTPDAYLCEPADLDRLVAPIRDGRASLAYGRQVPHGGAGFFEAFPRQFSYPLQSHIRSIADVPRFGVYSFFCSDAFAAYRNRALDDIGGFRATLSHEDAIAAAMLLQAGHRIAYVAEAVVSHSHRYTLGQEFGRYFAAGFARRQFREVLALGGRDSRLGRSFVRAMMVELLRTRPWLLPYAAAHLAAKALGYRAGAWAAAMPGALRRRLGAQYCRAGDKALPADRRAGEGVL